MATILTIFLCVSASIALSLPDPVTTSRSVEQWDTPPNPIPPSQDPFYTAPPGFARFSPGTVLRFREAPGNFTNIIANYSAAYNILYRTSDAAGHPSWAVTTLLSPTAPYVASGKDTAKCAEGGTALLSYQAAYDSASVDASPSYLMYDPAQAYFSGDIAASLDRGWSVSAPDFEGPLAAFTAGLQAGYATLDNIRAVLQFAREQPALGLSPGAKHAMWGYSGGSTASEWAAELQGSYSPTLDFEGIAIGGMVVDLKTTFDELNRTPFAADNVAGLLGITAEFPDARTFLVSKLKTTGPYNETTFLGALNQTLNQALGTFSNQNITEYFADGGGDINAPVIAALFASQGVMGRYGVPRMPVFAYKAIGDEFSPIAQSDSLVAKYCTLGANILYERNTVGDHLAEFTSGQSRSLEWLASVFNGTHGENYGDYGCTVKNVTIADPSGSLL